MCAHERWAGGVMPAALDWEAPPARQPAATPATRDLTPAANGQRPRSKARQQGRPAKDRPVSGQRAGRVRQSGAESCLETDFAGARPTGYRSLLRRLLSFTLATTQSCLSTRQGIFDQSSHASCTLMKYLALQTNVRSTTPSITFLAVFREAGGFPRSAW